MAGFQRSGAVQRIAAAFREDHHQDPDTAALGTGSTKNTCADSLSQQSAKGRICLNKTRTVHSSRFEVAVRLENKISKCYFRKSC